MSIIPAAALHIVKYSYDLCKSIEYNNADANHTLRRLERHQVLVNELLTERNGVVLPPEYAACFDEIQQQLRKVEKKIRKTKDANVASKAWNSTDFKRIIQEADNVIHELRFQQSTSQHRVQQQMLGNLQVGQAEVQEQTQEILLRTHLLETELREVARILRQQVGPTHNTLQQTTSPLQSPVEPSTDSGSGSKGASIFRRFSTRSSASRSTRPASIMTSHTTLSESEENAQEVDARLADSLARLGITAPSVLSDGVQQDSAHIKLDQTVSNPLGSLDAGVEAVKRERRALTMLFDDAHRPVQPRRQTSTASSTMSRSSSTSTARPETPTSALGSLRRPSFGPVAETPYLSTSPASLSATKERMQAKQNERLAKVRTLQSVVNDTRATAAPAPAPLTSLSTATSAMPTLASPLSLMSPALPPVLPQALPPALPPRPIPPHFEKLSRISVDASTSSFTTMHASRDGRYLAVGGSRADNTGKRAGFIALYQVAPVDNELQRLLWKAMDSAITCFAWSFDGQMLFCGSEAMTVDIYRPRGLTKSPTGQPPSKIELRKVASLQFDTSIIAIATPGPTALDKGAMVIATHASHEKTILFHRYWWKTAGVWSMETTLTEDKTSRFTVPCNPYDEPTLSPDLRFVISHNGTRLQIPGRPAVLLRERDAALRHVTSVADGTRLLFLPSARPQVASFQLYDAHTGVLVSSMQTVDSASCEAPLHGCAPLHYGLFRPLVYTADGNYGVQATQAGLFLRNGKGSPLEPPLANLEWDEQGSWDAPCNSNRNHLVLMGSNRTLVILPEGGKELRVYKIAE